MSKPNDSDNKKKIQRWARPLVFPFDTDQPRAAFLSLKHVGVSGKLQDVRTFKVSDKVDEVGFASLCVDLETAILDDTEGTGGLQRYSIHAMDEGKATFARLTIRCAATRSEDEADAFDSEPADSKGHAAQLMRHNEARERIDKAGWGTLINTQRQMIEDLATKNTELVDKNMEMIALMEELQSMRHQREMDIEEQRAKIENRGRITRQITSLIPAAVKKLTGEDIGGVVEPDTLSMREMLQTLREDQLERILGVLDQAQQISLLSLMKGEAEKSDEKSH